MSENENENNSGDLLSGYLKIVSELESGPLSDADIIHLLFGIAHSAAKAGQTVLHDMLHCVACGIGKLAGTPLDALNKIHADAPTELRRLVEIYMKCLELRGVVVVDSYEEFQAVMTAMHEKPTDPEKLN